MSQRNLVIIASSLTTSPELLAAPMEAYGLPCEVTPPHVAGAVEVVEHSLDRVGLVLVDPHLPLEEGEWPTLNSGLRVAKALGNTAQDALVTPVSSDVVANLQLARELERRDFSVLMPERPEEQAVMYGGVRRIMEWAAGAFVERIIKQ